MTVLVTSVGAGENWFPIARRIAGPQASGSEVAGFAHRLALRNGYSIDVAAPLGMSLLYLSEDLEELVPSHVTISFPSAIDVSPSVVTAVGLVGAPLAEATTPPTSNRVPANWFDDDPNSPFGGTEGRYPVTTYAVPSGFPVPDDEGVGLPSDWSGTASGSYVASAGETIENLDITGRLYIPGNADNVTVRNCRITRSGGYPVQCSSSNAPENLLIENCRIRGVGADVSSALVLYGSGTVRDCFITGGQDGIKPQGDYTISGNVVTGLYRSPGTHNDCIQHRGGATITISGNTLIGPYQMSTSAIIMSNSLPAQLRDITVTDNYLSGGSNTFYLGDKGNGAGVDWSSIVVTGNYFEVNSYTVGPRSFDSTPGTYSGNVDYDPT